jgi:GNAT superfamily N-acetyltransferase
MKKTPNKSQDGSNITTMPGVQSTASEPNKVIPPEGKLLETITWLQMLARHRPAKPLSRLEHLAVLRACDPTLSYYRYLYNHVGGPWLWYERRLMSDAELKPLIENIKISIFVLYSAGVPAGFAELDARDAKAIELCNFGLIPEYTGRGLGRFFLDWLVDQAWDMEPERLFVSTSTLDHPKAVNVYQQAGFEPYAQETRVIDDPRLKPGWSKK